MQFASRKGHIRLSQIAKLLDISFNKNRGEREKKKWKKKRKKNPEAQQNSNDDTTNTVGKVVMRKIQWHQERLPTMIRVGHPNSLKESENRWTTYAAHSVHCLWDSLISLDSSCWYIFIILVVPSSEHRCAFKVIFLFFISPLSL